MKTTTRLGLLGILHFAFCILHCHAELTATVYPGYTFSASERPTTATLNLLARPTVVVSGTLGGTNVGLAANSVSGLMLMSSVVDDDTIEFFDNSGVTSMRVKAYNIGTNVVDANIAGLGLGGGDGYALSNKVDGVNITVTNDTITLLSLSNRVDNLTLRLTNNVLTLGTNSPAHVTWVTNTILGAATYGTNGHLAVSSQFAISTNSLRLREYESSAVAISSMDAGDVPISATHGLGATPKWVRAILVCTDADNDYAVGDEVDAFDVSDSKSGPVIRAYANSTTVGVSVRTDVSSWKINGRLGNTPAAIGTSKWTLKVVARP